VCGKSNHSGRKGALLDNVHDLRLRTTAPVFKQIVKTALPKRWVAWNKKIISTNSNGKGDLNIYDWPKYRDKHPTLTLHDLNNLAKITGSCHKRQKPQAPTPQAPIRNRQTRKVTNAKGVNRNNLT